MKQFVIIIGLAVLVMITTLCLQAVESKADRKDELERMVSAAVKQTVKESVDKKQTTITSDKEMVAYFINNLSLTYKADGDLTIKVMDADYKEGLLDIIVVEKFKYSNGKTKTIDVRKCAIYQ